MIANFTYRLKPLGLILSSTLFLSACATDLDLSAKRVETRPVTNISSQTLVDEKKPVMTGNQSIGENVDSAPLLRNAARINGDDTTFSLPSEPVSLNADNLALNHFINLALGDVLNLSYVVDQSLKSRDTPITLRIAQPIDSQRMLGLVEEVLQVNGVGLLAEDGLIKVVPANQLANRAPVLLSESIGPRLRYGNVVEIIPVYYLLLNDASTLVSQLIRDTRGSSVLSQRHLNALMVVARQDDIEKIHQMLAQLDVPKKVASHMKLIQPAYLPLDEMIEDLKKALFASGVPVAEDNGVNGVVLTRMSNNTLLVTASTKRWLKYTEDWAARIDKPKPIGGNDGVYAYYMRNGKAEDAWGVISAIFGQQVAGEKDSATGVDLVREAQQAIQERNNRTTSDYTLPGNASTRDRSRRNTSGNDSVITEEYRVVVDQKRNAIIFTGRYSDYQRLIQLLEFVDQRPRQVLIEAIVAEVGITDSQSLGVDWEYNSTNANQGNKLLSLIGQTTGESAGSTLSFAMGKSIMNISALLTQSDSKILATPRILALDQESARFNAGDQVQVTTGTVTNENGSITQLRQFVNTGVTIEITPYINQNGLVEMEVNQQVSTPNSDNTAINNRAIQTVLLAESGQMVYMGGLINRKTSISENKVPLLGDIPLLGNLFKFKSESQNNTEVVLLITPYVITSREDADFYTEEFRQLTGWDPLID
ncbi:secretin [Vibrio metschnikovii]|nr:secretin [Vibrio metschnikovii]EKO3770711.1 secretin [Vibrio metschnikovii]